MRLTTSTACFISALTILTVVGCSGDDPAPVSSEQAPVAETAPLEECDADGSECRRYDIAGTCLKNRCVLPSGYCSYDVDCADGNECSLTKCVKGSCEVTYADGALCESGDGTCHQGFCVEPAPDTCKRDRDCESAAGACASAVCEAGACVVAPKEEGASCRLASRKPGTCRENQCIASAEREPAKERCRVVPTMFGPTMKCSTRMRFELPPEELAEQSEKLAQSIQKTMLYDVKVSLVPLADGGYNILVFNEHDRSDVRGLVDPSFVAFDVAGFTEGSDWKSRQLHIWLDPYNDGWQIPTAGGRKAVRRGRDASLLGALGVVDIKGFRTWLQRTFRSLTPPPPQPLRAPTKDALMRDVPEAALAAGGQ